MRDFIIQWVKRDMIKIQKNAFLRPVKDGIMLFRIPFQKTLWERIRENAASPYRW
jgi:hypothetical protein